MKDALDVGTADFVPALLGYARMSTDGQDLTTQQADLQQAMVLFLQAI